LFLKTRAFPGSLHASPNEENLLILDNFSCACLYAAHNSITWLSFPSRACGREVATNKREAVLMKLIHVAKRRADGLIDSKWVEGFDASRSNDCAASCPYSENTDEFRSWQEGWLYATDPARTESSRPTDPIFNVSFDAQGNTPYAERERELPLKL
jgi:hypothetical protein